ncbi:hypothetical protein C1J05_06010 [Sulfitobacter sp. JL08]|uniref:glycosyltransferase family protein n=1 Tax=Sulfitobacter sp. JL08 TaxID=2070369 RepID=UPI000E0BA08C|nr:hypothetical protein [Sulfitobacter sp. JL08]AXI54102.1 hypothetical protein C1J05_06010 [Sulfitobacter sp. JL08]
MTLSDDTSLKWLTGRCILLVSPQPWDHLPISKHHYAEALAERNTVAFLQPPVSTLKPGTVVATESGINGISLISWTPFTPKILRFHAYGLYKWFIGREARQIGKAIGVDGKPDLLWCFDFNTFPDLRAFGATRVIYHPVDPLSDHKQARIGKTADLILSVSNRILTSFDGMLDLPPRHLVNHGIGSAFTNLARSPAFPRKDGPIRCGYFGNMDRAVIDGNLIAATVAAQNGVEFHFWGPITKISPLAPLRSAPNCIFHGTVPKDALARAAADMDCFLVAYRADARESDLSNAHKLLEYFATGRTVIATPMDCYRDDPELLAMSSSSDLETFITHVAETFASLSTLNADTPAARRKAVALEHTYERNIARIDALLAVRDA